MEIKYNLTGTERKALVKAVSNIIGEKSKYLGAPSFAYQSPLPNGRKSCKSEYKG